MSMRSNRSGFASPNMQQDLLSTRGLLAPTSITPISHGSPRSSRHSSMSSRSEAPHHSAFSKDDVMGLPDNAMERFDLFEEIGQGTYGLVHRAFEKSNEREVAIKIVENVEDNMEEILQEYQILSDHCLHPNIPLLYGAFRCGPHIWFSLELCGGGPASELARQLVKRGRRLIDDQIAYIIKEVLHALIYLQDSMCIHRDVKGSNILLTSTGEIKLVDYGISCQLRQNEERRKTRVGTPYWMAPEVIMAGDADVKAGYDGRCDVWSLGVTIIELAEGHPPLSDLQPMRALMQIPKNPPPRLSHPEEWGQAINDIVTETLVKDPDQRPMLQEIIEHPLFQSIPRNPTYIQHGLILLTKWIEKAKCLKVGEVFEDETAHNKEFKPKSMNDADMIKTENIVNSSEYMQSKKIAETLNTRREAGLPFTYAGDLLISLNPPCIDENDDIKVESHEPHIVAVTENLYNRMLHDKKDQLLLNYGYSNTGISNIYSSALKTLTRLGTQDRFENKNTKNKVLSSEFILGALTSRSGDKGRTGFRITNVNFNSSGCLSGANFSTYFHEGYLDLNKEIHNIRIFRTVIVGLRMQGRIREFGLHHFLDEEEEADDQTKQQLEEFTKFVKSLQCVGFRVETGINLILRMLVAIQLVFKINFAKEGDTFKVLNKDVLESVSNLLELDEEFLLRALTQTNVLIKGTFYHAQEPHKNVAALAGVLYSRLIDWVEDYINSNLKLSTAVYGFKNAVILVEFPAIVDNRDQNSDDFGSLMSNSVNEILHWITQKLLIKWEELEAKNNRIRLLYPCVHDNKATLDGIFASTGFLPTLNECALNKTSFDPELSTDMLSEKFCNSPDCYLDGEKLKINHFWSQVEYKTKHMVERNENFVNPELIQTMGSSSDECIRTIFQLNINQLGKVDFDENIEEEGFSQTLAQQTILSRFSHWTNKLISLIVSTSSHLVFSFQPGNSLTDQIESFNMKEIAYVRKKGFPYRLTFADLLRRYCFLAFNFDERVVATRDNAQLLMIRLGIDGFECGKRKIFLKYYHISYLSEMYNNHHKKIVVVQSAARRFLGRKRAEREKTARLTRKIMAVRRVITRWKKYKSTVRTAVRPPVRETDEKFSSIQKEKAALEIQRHFRGFSTRQRLGVNTRFNLLKVLASPCPQRKEMAENLLKDEGLTLDQAKAAVAEVELCIKERMTDVIISKEELIKVFSNKVFNENICVQASLKKINEETNIAKIEPVPQNFRIKKISAEDFNEIQKVRKRMTEHHMPPVKLYDIEAFYTDRGPDQVWDKEVEEKTFAIDKRVLGQNDAMSHVIKERTTEKYRRPSLRPTELLSTNSGRKPSLRPTDDGLLVAQSQKSSGSLKDGRGGAVSPAGGSHRSYKSSREPRPTSSSNQTQKVSVVPKVLSTNKPRTSRADVPTSQNKVGSQIVHQLNMIQKAASCQEEEEGQGPFDFRALLRRTDRLPTDTLKICRLRNPVLKQHSEDEMVMRLGKDAICL